MMPDRWPEIPDDIPATCAECGRALTWQEGGDLCRDCGNDDELDRYKSEREDRACGLRGDDR